MDRNETIKAIRTALKERSGKAWSVKGDRGTAYGWIHISVPPKRLGCGRHHDYMLADDRCKVCDVDRYDGTAICEAHVCSDKCSTYDITPEDRDELSKLLGVRVHNDGVSIPASSDYYNEYVARAAGLTPFKCGEPYWD